MIKKLPILLASTVLLVSCSQTVALKTITTQYNFTSQPEKATIYIYRDEDFGGALPLSISVNDLQIGKTTGRTFFQIVVQPNVYKFTTELGNQAPLVLKVEGGKNYFIRQELKVGWIRPSTLLEIVDSNTGQSGVKASSRLESNSKLKH
jgi:hypothetical protein